LGIGIVLAEKPMEEGLDLAACESSSYQAIKEKFEETNFKCIDQASFYNIDHKLVRMRSKKDLMTAYEHLVYIDEDGKQRGFINKWFKDPEMRTYEFVRCVPPPLICDEHTFNLWSGFSVESEPETDLDGFGVLLNHIKFLSNNNEEVFDFVQKWLACLLQKPGYKNNVALLFNSKQGAGKDAFYTMLERLIGSKYCGNTSRPERDIFGDFNSFLHNKVLVVMNEFSGKVGFKYSDQLKDLITNLKEPIRKCEPM
jgi:phage/plasmid-associated DNA primase